MRSPTAKGGASRGAFPLRTTLALCVLALLQVGAAGHGLAAGPAAASVSPDRAEAGEGEAADADRSVRGRDTPAFPPDPSREEARRRLLEKVKVDPKTAGDGGRPPNIVLILADDLGYGDTGIYGSKAIQTPHIDALARSGVWMTDAYATAATCSPSRAALLTGRYQQRYGFVFNPGSGALTYRMHRGLDPEEVTLADLLKQAGYATGAFGKWHLGTRPHMHPQSRGFDEFFGFLAGQHSYFPEHGEDRPYISILRGRTPVVEPEYLTDAIARETVRFIAAHRSRPFFAYVPFSAVHSPMEASPRHLAAFSDEENPDMRTLKAMTRALDEGVGAIVGALEEHGLTSRTLVIFTNDNGAPSVAENPSNTSAQSNRPLRMGKMSLYEGGIRVPMILSWPGVVPSGSAYRGTTSTLDVVPTVAAAAGLVLPEDLVLDGVDLVPFITGRSQGRPHETLFWGRAEERAIREGDWKLIESFGSVRLYDLSADPGEMKDLAGERPEVVEELRAEMERWRAELPPPAWPAPSGSNQPAPAVRPASPAGG